MHDSSHSHWLNMLRLWYNHLDMLDTGLVACWVCNSLYRHRILCLLGIRMLPYLR